MRVNECTYNCVNGRIYMASLGGTQPCPDCSTAGDIFSKTEEDVQERLHRLNIPEEYDINALLDEELITQQTRNIFSQESIQSLTSVLHELNNAVHNGGIVKRSIYLHAPTLDIKLFAYNLMLRAQEQGIVVAPFISINTLHDIQRSRDYDYAEYERAAKFQGAFDSLSSAQKQYFGGYKELERLQCAYADFLDAGLLILEATANTTEKTWFSLADILAERENRQLPTYIVGYFSERQLNERGARYIVRDSDALAGKLGKFEVHGLVTKKAQGYRDGNNNKGNNYNPQSVMNYMDSSVQQNRGGQAPPNRSTNLLP